MFTMLIVSLTKSNFVGFVLYFITYQLASIVRVMVYGMVLQEKAKDNVLLVSGYDYFDVASFITQNNIPRVSFFPLYTMAFTLAFVLFNVGSHPMSYPQIGVSFILLLFIVLYLLTIYMTTSAFVFSPYIELLSGYATGSFSSYMVSKLYPAGLLFSQPDARRKRFLCKLRNPPTDGSSSSSS
jgi:hypothetical protein